ncbi:hypothetical protein [Streptomyces sp. NPDC001292]|uniref:hypothetical protein n=1 Tax=Streptomyces sp. NPDC001292 TaxID=3364558 RepID=UPI003698BD32
MALHRPPTGAADEPGQSPGPPTRDRCPATANLLGRYSFAASTPAAGALRPLRDPDAPELDEDDEGVD